MVELSVLGISLQEESGTPLLLLHPQGSQAILTLDIGAMEAFAISFAMHARSDSQRFPRSTTHDLMGGILRALDAKLVCVRLTDLVEGVYIAEAVLSHMGREAVIDCRPSDAIATALRCGAPIRASAAVVALARDIDEVMGILPEHVRAIAASKLAELPPKGLQFGPGQNSAAEEGRSGPQLRQIRVMLMRHTSDGKTEIVNEFTVGKQNMHIPIRASAGAGLSPREAGAVNEASDEDHWGTLLRMLAPETKVPM